MSVDLSKEIWDELKRYVNPQDRDEAAETLVSVLIDNDCDAADIKSVFKSDSEVKSALASYLKDHEEEYDEDEEEEYEEDEEDYQWLIDIFQLKQKQLVLLNGIGAPFDYTMV